MIIQLLSQAVDLVHVLVRGAALALQDHNLLQLRLQFVVQLFRVVFVLRIQVLVLDSQLFYLLAIARDVKLLVQGSELIDLYLLALQLPLQLVLLCQQTLVPRFSV